MIKSPKNHTKKKKTKKKRTDGWNPRTSSKNKAIQTKSHTDTYKDALTKREKGKKYIYHFSYSPPP